MIRRSWITVSGNRYRYFRLCDGIGAGAGGKTGTGSCQILSAETSGGLAAIKALAAPYVGMKFMPTGGINLKNVRSYLESDVILACGGSWMVKKDLIQSGQFDAVRQMTADAVALVKEVRGSQEK